MRSGSDPPQLEIDQIEDSVQVQVELSD
jgi:hypothetical protein